MSEQQFEFCIDDSERKFSGIYKITNNINDKIYIGNSFNFRKRFWEHDNALKRNRHHSIIFQRFYNKYLNVILKFEKIEVCEKEQLLVREQYFMDFYQSYNTKFGYNICKIANSRLGCKHSAETRQKMKGMNTGEKNGMYGKTISEEIKAQKKLKFSVPVNQITKDGDLIEKFSSSREASKKLNLNERLIANVCKGKKLKTGGCYFEYSEIDKKNLYPRRKSMNIKQVQMFKDNILIETFESIDACVKFLQITRNAFNKRIYEKGYKGFTFLKIN